MPQKVKEQRIVDEENQKQRMLRQQAMEYEKTKVGSYDFDLDTYTFSVYYVKFVMFYLHRSITSRQFKANTQNF